LKYEFICTHFQILRFAGRKIDPLLFKSKTFPRTQLQHSIWVWNGPSLVLAHTHTHTSTQTHKQTHTYALLSTQAQTLSLKHSTVFFKYIHSLSLSPSLSLSLSLSCTFSLIATTFRSNFHNCSIAVLQTRFSGFYILSFFLSSQRAESFFFLLGVNFINILHVNFLYECRFL